MTGEGTYRGKLSKKSATFGDRWQSVLWSKRIMIIPQNKTKRKEKINVCHSW